MSSRHSAARPNRAGESFARVHHGRDEPSSKRVKFDVRNPSALAPDEREDDAILDADVIGGGATTKRGAVNIDGYDSDSDNDNLDRRAEERHRKKGDLDILKQLDDYGQNGHAPSRKDEEDEDDDMFAEDGDDRDAAVSAEREWRKKRKQVNFLDEDKIQGQEMTSKSGGQVHLDDDESSDDEEDRELAIQEEGVDEEVGAGGLKRNAPKVEAFNMKEEQEEGRFDQDGNYIRKAGDPDAAHDKWLEGVSKKEMRKAAAAHEKREAEARKQRMEEDSILTPDLLKALILRLEKSETPLEALARLGKGQKKTKAKAIPKWKLKRQNKSADADGMDVDAEKAGEDPEQVRIREAINAITDAADKLLSRDYAEIYEQERELLVREWRRETGEEWVEPAQQGDTEDVVAPAKMWEFRWTDGRDGAKQGPFDIPTMKAWQDAGYFREGVEFRPAGEEAWSRVASFV